MGVGVGDGVSVAVGVPVGVGVWVGLAVGVIVALTIATDAAVVVSNSGSDEAWANGSFPDVGAAKGCSGREAGGI